MQERQVTVEGDDPSAAPPFIVLATQNPIEYEGTYPLPEAQLDRFLIKASGRLSDREEEWRCAAPRARADEVTCAGGDRPRSHQAMHAGEEDARGRAIGRYIVDVVDRRAEPTRSRSGPARGSLALLKLAVSAAPRWRDFVTPEDVKVSPCRAPAHRLMVRSSFWVSLR